MSDRTRPSAGIVLYRFASGRLLVLLAHMGGPVHGRRHAGAWTIPKGHAEEGEDLRAAALREFAEEMGRPVQGTLLPLTPIVQRSGREVHAWAVEGDFDVDGLHSNTFRMEWPPRSGRMQEFPEVDRAAWLTVPEAVTLAIPGQGGLFLELESKLTAQHG
jgi:predicted NUDIX family NTP pyrophosphohydrolase